MQNKPKLRFKEFNYEWQEDIIFNLFNSYTTNSFSRDCLDDRQGSICNIHYGDIHRKYSMVLDCQTAHIPYVKSDIDISNIKAESYCQNGDLIIADASEDVIDIAKAIELTNLNNKKILAGLHTILYRQKVDNFANGFMGYLFATNKIKRQVCKMATNSKIYGITKNNLNKIKIKFPEVQEQQKIAEFLRKVDELILEQEAKVKNLEQKKKGLMQKLFSQKLRFTNSQNQPYPDWEGKQLGKICKTFSGGTPSVVNSDYYNGNIPFIKSGEIHSDKTEAFISEEGLKNSSAKLVNTGDLLFALYGATSGEVDISKINGAINQAILCVRSDSLNLVYLKNLLLFEKEKILSKYLQGGQGNLSADIFKSLKSMFPHLEEQEKIAAILSKMDELIEENKALLTSWQQLKKALLQQMFV